MILISLPIIDGYTSLTAFSLPNLALIIIHKLSWLYGPCVYCFLRLLLKQPIYKKAEIALHLIPFVYLCFIILAGFYRETIWLAAATLGQVGLYLGLSGLLLIKRRDQALILFRKFKYTSWYWFGFMTVGAFALMVFEATSIYSYLSVGGLPAVVWHSFMSILVVYNLCIAGISLLSPKTLVFNEYELEDSAVPVLPNTQVESDCQPSYKELTPEDAECFARELEAIMRKDKPYLQNDLRLNDLARILGISSHQLSELLNTHLGTSFYDYINKCRYETARSLLRDANSRLSILEVAYQAGFNSKNTFYRVFKQFSGHTPSSYRKQFLSHSIEWDDKLHI